ncbi:MAG: hypothetical protein H6711_31045 [Myxococcales bacterium]|nr:hypothetical protein [Myxococcales bacterium]
MTLLDQEIVRTRALPPEVERSLDASAKPLLRALARRPESGLAGDEPIEFLAMVVLMCLPGAGPVFPGLPEALTSALQGRIAATGGADVEALAGQLTTRYAANVRVVKALVKAYAHVLDNPQLRRHPELFFAHLLDLVIAQAHPVSAERSLGAPSRRLAELMYAMLELEAGQRLLDPCFDVGLSAATYLRHAPEGVLPTAVGERPGRTLLGLVRCLLHGRTQIELVTDAEVGAAPGFDRVLLHGEWSARRRGAASLPRDHELDELLKNLGRLRPGGRLVALCSFGVLFHASGEARRRRLFTEFAVDEIIVVPGELFTPFRRAVILSIRRPARASELGAPVGIATPAPEDFDGVVDQAAATRALERICDPSALGFIHRFVAPRAFYEGNSAMVLLSPAGERRPALVEALERRGVPIRPLAESALVISGRRHRRAAQRRRRAASGGSLRLVRVRDLDPKRKARAVFIPRAEVRGDDALREDDLLLARKSDVGRTLRVDAAAAADGRVAGDGFVIIRRGAAGEVLDMRYLEVLLASDEYQRWLRLHAVGATRQTRIRLADLGALPIPLPPLAVQERVVHERAAGSTAPLERLLLAALAGDPRGRAR